MTTVGDFVLSAVFAAGMTWLIAVVVEVIVGVAAIGTEEFMLE